MDSVMTINTIFFYVLLFFASVGFFHLVNSFKFFKVLWNIIGTAVLIASIPMFKFNAASVFCLTYFILAIIYNIGQFKVWCSPSVVIHEEYIKREIDDEKRWDDMINGEWFKNICKNVNNIFDAE